VGAWLGRVWAKTPRPVVIAASVLVVLAASFALAFGPIVRSRLGSEAERRGMEVSVSSVRPGFFSVGLRGVLGRPRDVPGVVVRLDEVRVDLSASLGVRAVTARGGAITVDGDPEELQARLKALRQTSDNAGGGKAASSHVSARAENLTVTWKLPSGEELSGTGLTASREGETVKLSCAACTGRYRHLAIEVSAAEVELEGGAMRRVGAGTVVVAYEPPPAAAPSVSSASAVALDPAPPPLPPSATSGRKGKPSRPSPLPAATPATSPPMFPFPDLHALRARIRTLGVMVAPRIPDGATIDLGGLSARLDVGGEVVAFGPGAFTLSRKGDRVHVAFASVRAEGASGTPLSVDADLPLEAGDVSAHLAGGPVSLALLGVKEGTKGLADVGRGTVEGKGLLVLSDAADALTFDGRVTLRSLAINEPRIALSPVRGIDFSVSGRGMLGDNGRLRIDDAELDMGALHAKMHGTVEETSDHYAISLSMDVAPAACQALLDSTPEGLLPIVRPSRMTGVFGASMSLGFDSRTLDKLALDYRIDDRCKMLEVPRELSRDRFTGSFTYRTYHPDGTSGDTTTGPGSDSWTALEDISPFMVAAVLTTEDGAFYKHHGFNHAAIRSSVQANLKAGRFVRGASTITMQLAKNLFLSRDKALSRKIEEVILTDYLEQIFQKDEMMELYLNVVEFGPDVYGVTQAADFYFGRKPGELNLAECFFLATLLPSPIRFGKLREKGEVPETWLRHLRALMEIAAKNGKISHSELEDGQKESVVFVRDGEPRPEPRKPVGPRRDPFDDDAAWQPLN
jgi:hypothetical protein